MLHPNTTSSTSGASSPPVGAIVGGVIGGLIALAALILVALLLTYIRRQKPVPWLPKSIRKSLMPELEDGTGGSQSEGSTEEKAIAIHDSQTTVGAKSMEWRLHELSAEKDRAEIGGKSRAEMEGSVGSPRTTMMSGSVSSPTEAERSSGSPPRERDVGEVSPEH